MVEFSPPEPQAPSGPPTAEQPWPVATVAQKLHDWIARLGSVWVEGELTGWNVRGGHAYAKLRDLHGDASLSLTVWRSVRERLEGEFRQGDRVVVCAKPDFWVRGGQLSLQVSQMRHVGLGELLERLERLRRSLAEEGLFDPERKHRLPFLPGCIGLVTGRDSDAEKDVRRNAELRWPAVRFRTIHTAVQGERTVPEVSAALRELEADPEVEVIIVARGGGDFLHLLPFSDESLVRLVAGMSTPVVSAIGHEADRPILDEVADLRASTPTDAAKRVVPEVTEELTRVQQARTRIFQLLATLVGNESRGLEAMRSRPVLAQPAWIVDRRAEELVRLEARAEELVRARLERAEDRLHALSRQLTALSPQRTLDRGYAIVERDEQASDPRAERPVVRSVRELSAGDGLRIRIADGRVLAETTRTEAIVPPDGTSRMGA
ncbi:MAG: exodeoxyribonuclease VII large subunit [Pseudoclavibacter sp.]|nr:exodeoxyribonuclease VII large subunit [Pseudoclavibacter sp.]